MDTTTKQDLEKQAAVPLTSLLKGIVASGAIPKHLWSTYLLWAAALGGLGGTGAGIVSSYVKAKNPEALSLDRQKRFYDRKIDEMANENWLNDLMAAKKKLDTGKLSPEERDVLEKKYVALINK